MIQTNHARNNFGAIAFAGALSSLILSLTGHEAFTHLTRIFTGPPGVARQEDFAAIAATGGTVAKVYVDDNRLADGPQCTALLMYVLVSGEVAKRVTDHIISFGLNLACGDFELIDDQGTTGETPQHMLLLAMSVPMGSDGRIDPMQAPLEQLAGIQKLLDGSSLVGLAKNAITTFNNRGTDEVPAGTWHATGRRPVAHQTGREQVAIAT